MHVYICTSLYMFIYIYIYIYLYMEFSPRSMSQKCCFFYFLSIHFLTQVLLLHGMVFRCCPEVFK